MCPAQNRCSEKSNSSGGGDDLDDNASVGGGDVIGKGYSSKPTIVASNLAQICGPTSVHFFNFLSSELFLQI